jgi:seryl-tRNA synthetase
MAEVAALKATLEANEAALAELLKRMKPSSPRSPTCRRRACRWARTRPTTSRCKRWGTPRSFDFAVQGSRRSRRALGQLDFETAAKISGARFLR